jgi:hypothetical protein
MKKHVAPIVALAGIALLSPNAKAADLIIKSRAIPVGGAGSLPIIVRNVGGSGELWGIDAGLKFGTANVAPAAERGAFAATNFDPARDVVMSRVPTTGDTTRPDLCFGTARSATGLVAAGSELQAVGSLKLKVTGGAAKEVYSITAPDYNVKKAGVGSLVSRPGATATTSRPGGPVATESVTLFTGYLAGREPVEGNPDLRVPTARIAAGAPGDINGDGQLGPADLGNIAAALTGKAAATWTEYKRIAADVAPLNGYTPQSIGGANGQSYGDGNINAADLGLLSAKLANKPNALNFPVPE